jgi:hypothetical protein
MLYGVPLEFHIITLNRSKMQKLHPGKPKEGLPG